MPFGTPAVARLDGSVDPGALRAPLFPAAIREIAPRGEGAGARLEAIADRGRLTAEVHREGIRHLRFDLPARDPQASSPAAGLAAPVEAARPVRGG